MYEFNLSKVKDERRAKGVNLTEMARRMDMSPGAYSKKENGHIRFNVDDLAKYFEVLNIPRNKCGIFFTNSVSKLTTNKMKEGKENARFTND